MGRTNIIHMNNLTKRYGSITAVEDLNLTIRQGEVFGLLGPNGAGKTTTTLMLLGLTEPTAGTAVIDGSNCTRNPLAVKRIVGYLPDHVGFYSDLTGRENLELTGRLNGLPAQLCHDRASELLERVGMTYAADRKTGGYSRGMKQRLGIADVLMKDPKVIIMDEPTLGIDPEGMRELISLIRELSVKDGRTILISSHQLYQVQQICDRVGIFVKGHLIACGKINELGQQLQNEGLYILDLQASPCNEQLETLLKKISSVRSVSRDADDMIHIESSRDIRSDLTELVAANGYTLLQLHQRGGDLEEIYRRYFEKAGEEHEVAADQGQKRSIRTLLQNCRKKK